MMSKDSCFLYEPTDISDFVQSVKNSAFESDKKLCDDKKLFYEKFGKFSNKSKSDLKIIDNIKLEGVVEKKDQKHDQILGSKIQQIFEEYTKLDKERPVYDG